MTALDDLIEWAAYQAGTEGAEEARRLGEAIAKEARVSLMTDAMLRLVTINVVRRAVTARAEGARHGK